MVAPPPRRRNDAFSTRGTAPPAADYRFGANRKGENPRRCLRKNRLFAGSEAGGATAAIAYTLIETAKPNGIDPRAWIADTLNRIRDYETNRIHELMPWNRNHKTPP